MPQTPLHHVVGTILLVMTAGFLLSFALSLTQVFIQFLVRSITGAEIHASVYAALAFLLVCAVLLIGACHGLRSRRERKYLS